MSVLTATFFFGGRSCIKSQISFQINIARIEYQLRINTPDDTSRAYKNMKNPILIFMLLSFIACSDPYHYVDPRNHEFITLPAKNRFVFKALIKIKAEAKCPSKIILLINQRPMHVRVNNYIDTIVSFDWYGAQMTFSAEIDSCIVGDPVIGVDF